MDTFSIQNGEIKKVVPYNLNEVLDRLSVIRTQKTALQNEEDALLAEIAQIQQLPDVTTEIVSKIQEVPEFAPVEITPVEITPVTINETKI